MPDSGRRPHVREENFHRQAPLYAVNLKRLPAPFGHIRDCPLSSRSLISTPVSLILIGCGSGLRMVSYLWSLLGAVIKGISHRFLRRPLDCTLDKLIVDAFMHKCARPRCAALALWKPNTGIIQEFATFFYFNM